MNTRKKVILILSIIVLIATTRQFGSIDTSKEADQGNLNIEENILENLKELDINSKNSDPETKNDVDLVNTLQPNQENGAKIENPENKPEQTPGLNNTTQEILETKTLSIPEIMALLVPPQDLSRIVEYKSDSDGRDGTLAYVEPADDTGKNWILGYDEKDTYDSSGNYLDINELLTTLIHEYGHIVMLNETQVNMVDDTAEYIECEYNESIVDEGCAYNSSYIHQFIQKYWSEELREEAYEASLDGTEEDFAYELYEQDRSKFVTEYAATNSIEDMAESFALFIMNKQSSSSTVANQKINFFYNYPELVDLRSFMQNGIAHIAK